MGCSISSSASASGATPNDKAGTGAAPTILGSSSRRRLSINVNGNGTDKESGGQQRFSANEDFNLEAVPGVEMLRPVTTGDTSCMKLLRQVSTSESNIILTSETDLEARVDFGTKPVTAEGNQFDPAVEGFGFACHKGKKPESPNQDSWCMLRASGEFSIYGVFDGHGKNGHDISNYVARELPQLLLKDDRFKRRELQALLTDAFHAMQSMIENATNKGEMDANDSGTTATVAIHDHIEGKLTMAHVGDSGCSLGTCTGRRPSSTGMFGGWRGVRGSKALTNDHKPENPEECERIQRAGGMVVFDGYANHRVFDKSGVGPGMNMSRAFGDLNGHRNAGIIATPTVAERSVRPGDDVLVMCSDGVWEFLEPDSVVKIVACFRAHESMDATTRVAQDSWKRWIEEEGNVVDDITALVVHLSMVKPFAVESGDV